MGVMGVLILFDKEVSRVKAYPFIISSTVILAADWSIAVGYWIVFHCFSLNVNARIRISVLSSLSVFYPTSPWQLWV